MSAAVDFEIHLRDSHLTDGMQARVRDASSLASLYLVRCGVHSKGQIIDPIAPVLPLVVLRDSRDQ